MESKGAGLTHLKRERKRLAQRYHIVARGKKRGNKKNLRKGGKCRECLGCDW